MKTKVTITFDGSSAFGDMLIDDKKYKVYVKSVERIVNQLAGQEYKITIITV
jgi:hypothetical protein